MSPSDRPCRQAHIMRTETFDDILTDNGIVNLLRHIVKIFKQPCPESHAKGRRTVFNPDASCPLMPYFGEGLHCGLLVRYLGLPTAIIYTPR
jgi:hypothetical protein